MKGNSKLWHLFNAMTPNTSAFEENFHQKGTDKTAPALFSARNVKHWTPL